MKTTVDETDREAREASIEQLVAWWEWVENRCQGYPFGPPSWITDPKEIDGWNRGLALGWAADREIRRRENEGSIWMDPETCVWQEAHPVN